MYSPKDHSITFGSIVATGYAEGTFIKAMRNEDAWSIKVGADGTVTRILNANKSGRFEITLMGSSPTNDLFAAQAILDEATGAGVNPCQVKDNFGTAKANGANAWIVKQADLERAKELGEVTWIIETDELDLSQGGSLTNL